MDQLADFLGHDIRVHQEYYRLPAATLQIAKISKMLLALERGNVSELQGRSLDEIQGIYIFIIFKHVKSMLLAFSTLYISKHLSHSLCHFS